MKPERITIHPHVMSGKPCIHGLRVTVSNILRQLANRRSRAEIPAAYPYLEAAEIDASLEFAALCADDIELMLSPA